jgi:hypothetical protein
MKTFNPILITILTLMMFFGCKHNNIENQLGPDYCSVVETPFKRNRVELLDFKTQADTLTAKISGNLEWHLKIKGRTSHAVKYFDSVSANVLQYWKGETDTSLFFQAGEYCDMEFSNNCNPTQVATALLKSNPNYSNLGLFIDDCETPIAKGGFSRDQGPTTNPVSWVFKGRDASNSVSKITAIEGTRFLRFATSGKSGWYVGAITYKASVGTIGTKISTFGGNDPSNIYLNFYYYNNGCKTNAVQLMLDELTPPSAQPSVRQIKLPVGSLTGWNFYSIKLSDLLVLNPANLTSLVFNCGPSEFDAPVDFSVDFVMITKGKPWIKQ